MKMDEVHVDI